MRSALASPPSEVGELGQMPRRAAYTKVEKTDRIRADHVVGMGDVAFRGFNCQNDEIPRVRKRLLDATGLDTFAVPIVVSEVWGKRAD